MNWQSITEKIEAVTGQPFKMVSADAIAGGDINSAYRLQGQNKSYFVKLNRADLAAMFEAEYAGLQAITKTQTVRVPAPVVCGKTSQHSFLVLEYIDLGPSTQASERLLGRQLALLHQQKQPYFGWHRDNTIGSTLQFNRPSHDWLTFWREQRLGFQLKLAADNGYGGSLQTNGDRLCSDMAALFANYLPQPSLLHGDLWAGNASVDKRGSPVIFDPACYYGDREADLAMTELFRGFSRDFYAAYQADWPLDHGFGTRKTFYNLYHILNHLNLFGGGYLRQAESMMNMLLAEIH
ncbi:MAG: fructosamine kinase family protein [Methylococcaceae bacterium]